MAAAESESRVVLMLRAAERMGGWKYLKSVPESTLLAQSLWRNGIARWTSNPEAPGSSPGRDESLCVPHGRPAVTFVYWIDKMRMFLVVDYKRRCSLPRE